jgi:hypothetical protein
LRLISAVLCVWLLFAPGASGSDAASDEPPVWFWFSTCGGPVMTLEWRLDGRLLHTASFPLCRALRSNAAAQGVQGRTEFSFRAGRAMTWKGYRDTSDRTAPGEWLTATVWQAGADPTWLTLGVDVMTGNRILMNTVNIAHPDVRDESTIARGLVLVTYPAPVR